MVRAGRGWGEGYRITLEWWDAEQSQDFWARPKKTDLLKRKMLCCFFFSCWLPHNGELLGGQWPRFFISFCLNLSLVRGPQNPSSWLISYSLCLSPLLLYTSLFPSFYSRKSSEPARIWSPLFSNSIIPSIFPSLLCSDQNQAFPWKHQFPYQPEAVCLFVFQQTFLWLLTLTRHAPCSQLSFSTVPLLFLLNIQLLWNSHHEAIPPTTSICCCHLVTPPCPSEGCSTRLTGFFICVLLLEPWIVN